MHEMLIVENVVELVLKQAEIAKAKKVLGVKLCVGEVRDIVDELMEKCFRFVARGSIAEEAHLEMERIPLVVRCQNCGHEQREKISHYATMQCAQCQSKSLEMVSGREFYIERIEII